MLFIELIMAVSNWDLISQGPAKELLEYNSELSTCGKGRWKHLFIH